MCEPRTYSRAELLDLEVSSSSVTRDIREEIEDASCSEILKTQGINCHVEGQKTGSRGYCCCRRRRRVQMVEIKSDGTVDDRQ